MSFRLDKIRKRFHELNLDALFVSNKDNVTYLTNFVGIISLEREAFLLLTPKQSYLLTFPTRFALYKNGNKQLKTLNITSEKKLSYHLSQIIKKEKLKTLGFEKDNLTVAELESLQNKLKIKLEATERLVENLRIIKDDGEITAIKKAAQVTDMAFSFIKGKIKKDISEKELALELEFFIKKQAWDVAFPPIVAFNKNAAIPHYIPNNRQHLTNKSLILLDFGAKVNNYCSDMTRVIFFGTPTNQQVSIYQTVLEAQTKAIAEIKPGTIAERIDKIARQYIEDCGYPAYPHGLGHGVGLAIHESPRLKPDHKDKLKENMVVTVEPGIYLEGQYGIRIEDLVVLNKGGIEVLSKSSKEITII